MYTFVPLGSDDDPNNEDNLDDVRFSMRKRSRPNLYDPSASLLGSQLQSSAGKKQSKAAKANKGKDDAPPKKRQKNEEPPPSSSEQKNEVVDPKAKKKGKGGRPTKAAAAAKAVLLATSQLKPPAPSPSSGIQTAFEAAAMNVLSQITKVTTAAATIASSIPTTNEPRGAPAAMVMDHDFLLKEDARRLKHQSDLEDRLYLHDKRQAELRRDMLADAHQFRMAENEMQGRMMLLNAGKGVGQAEGTVVKSKMKLTKAVEFCTDWFKRKGYQSRIVEGAVAQDIIPVGLLCLGQPAALCAAIADSNCMREKINLLVDGFKREDEEDSDEE